MDEPNLLLRQWIDKHGWYAMTTDIIDMRLDDALVRAGSWEDGFAIYWSDYVANDWVQYFPTRPRALAFLAALLHCIENGAWLTFDPQSDEFSEAVSGFFSEVTS